jgi:hypothetical protein
MISKEQKKAIKEGIIGIDKVKFHKDGSATAMRSYFYAFGMTPEKVFETVKKEFPDAKMIDCGDHYHDFVGGAETGSAKSNYMWARFTF